MIIIKLWYSTSDSSRQAQHELLVDGLGSMLPSTHTCSAAGLHSKYDDQYQCIICKWYPI